MSKNVFFSGPNTGKYGPEKTPYLGTFHAISVKYNLLGKMRKEIRPRIDRETSQLRETKAKFPFPFVTLVFG